MVRKKGVTKAEWLRERDALSPSLVLRIDDYPAVAQGDLGQFYPIMQRDDDKRKAIWPSEEKAVQAAHWAVKKFGHQYGIFRMVFIVEPFEAPVKVTEIKIS
jgi:hypothetical protein